jgi:hypothetical protein
VLLILYSTSKTQAKPGTFIALLAARMYYIKSLIWAEEMGWKEEESEWNGSFQIISGTCMLT